MGCAFSSPGALRPFAGVRVIHINGYVEDFDGPDVTVARVTGGKAASRYVLCSSAHLLQPGRGPFRPDDPLEPGTVYFLLPHSIFQSESSAVDLACLMNRLTALAREGGSGAAGPSPVEALFAGLQHAPIHHAEQPEKKPVSGTEQNPAPWKPRLDRIDESIGRASMRSASSCSACSEA